MDFLLFPSTKKEKIYRIAHQTTTIDCRFIRSGNAASDNSNNKIVEGPPAPIQSAKRKYFASDVSYIIIIIVWPQLPSNMWVRFVNRLSGIYLENLISCKVEEKVHKPWHAWPYGARLASAICACTMHTDAIQLHFAHISPNGMRPIYATVHSWQWKFAGDCVPT